MVRCANCGFENREAARFCKNCGKPLNAAASGGQPDATVAPAASSPTPADPLLEARPPEAPILGASAPVEAAHEASPIDASLIDASLIDAVRDEDVVAPPPPYEWHMEPAENLAPGAPTDEMQIGVAADDEIVDRGAAAEPIEQTVEGALETGTTETEAAMDGAARPAAEMELDTEDITPAQEFNAQDVAADAPAAAPRPAYTAGPRRPLARGTLIADRFLIVGIDAYDDEPTIYTVEDKGICPACGARVQPSEEEPFCPECGANLLSETAGKKIFELREVVQAGDGSDDEVGDNEIVWHGRRFEYVQPMHLGAESAEEGEEAGRSTTFKAGVNLMVGQRSDVGMARAGRPDEDSVFALTMTGIYDSTAGPTFGLYIVCDGMGGHGDGEIASRIAAKTISTHLIQTLLLPLLQGAELKPETVTANVDAAVQLANRRVVEDSVLRSNDMGTTMTMAVVIDRDVYVANVGDSRTYLWNETGLHRLTEDHSMVFQMVQEGALPEEAIYTHPARSQINRSLGMPGTIRPDHFHAELTPGSVLVLCCDGLWEVLRNDGIADVLMMGIQDPQTICDTMIRHANEAGGPDNISVIVVRASA